MSKLGLEYLKYIGKSPSDDSLIVDDVNDRVTIQDLTVNDSVGIGTSSPDYPLDIETASGDAEMRLRTAGTGSGDHTILRNQIDGTTGSNYIFFGDGSDSDVGLIQYNHGSNYMRFYSNAAERMRIDSDGNVGIGAAAPSGYRFEVTQGTAADLLTRTYNSDTSSTSDTIHQYRVNNNAATNYIQFGDTASASVGGIAYHHADNSLRFTTNAIDNFRMEADGDLHANGDVIAYSTTVSDERLKENIKIVDDALDKVKQLKGVTFTFKQDGKLSAGVIAQDVEKVLPEAVAEKKIPLKTNDGLLYKTVRYDALHSLLIEAIKELSAEVDELKRDR
jgi:hypothetical protein